MPHEIEPPAHHRRPLAHARVPVDILSGGATGARASRGYRVGRHVRYRRASVEAWLAERLDQRGWSLMAHVERRRVEQPDASGRSREVVRYRVRYRDASGTQHSETKTRLVDAERREAEMEVGLTHGTWRDPQQGDVLLGRWVEDWLPTRHDLRATTKPRSELTMAEQVLPRSGDVPLRRITNSEVRRWVPDLLDSGLAAASRRRAYLPSGRRWTWPSPTDGWWTTLRRRCRSLVMMSEAVVEPAGWCSPDGGVEAG